MLIGLSIRDFVIVDELSLELGAGFTVLTGETGAGKSILIDALQFALGERVPADTVREGCARAEVAAEFGSDPAVQDWLAQAEFDADAGLPAGAAPTVLVRRTLDATGRSRCFVNGSPATLGQVRALGELLLDIHGQHEHQSLLRPAAQQQLLDRHGGLREAVRAVAEAFEAWRSAERARTQAQELRDRAAAESAQLRQVVEDLESLEPEAGEWERIELEQRRLAHGAALLEGARSAVEAIAEAEDAAQPRLARVASRLGALSSYDPGLAPVLAALASADIHLEEAARALNHYLAQAETDEGRRAWIEERVAALHAAGRRWRCAPEALPALLQTARERLDNLDAAQDLERLRAICDRAAATYRERAASLSLARQQAARHMGQDVSRAMEDLAMTGGRFEVRLVDCEPGAAGTEKVEFLVSAHEGGTARPLARVASGGELSRISLAIAVIAASANPVPTLIFDEVDAGIGGPVAATVGRLLRELGKSRQVLCVTHLPQVASCGDRHLAVRKSKLPDGRPVSRTEVLEGGARVQEVARMLGGAQITPTTQRHAREMLAGG